MVGFVAWAKSLPRSSYRKPTGQHWISWSVTVKNQSAYNPSHYIRQRRSQRGRNPAAGFPVKNLPDTCIVIPNMELPHRNPRNWAVESLEFDCLLVAPHAVYHLENKHWNGRFIGNGHVGNSTAGRRKIRCAPAPALKKLGVVATQY